MSDEFFHQHRSLRTTPHPDEPSWDLEETLFAENDDIDDDDDAIARTNRRMVSFRRENSETLTSPNRTKREPPQPSPEVPLSSVRAKSFQEGRRDSSHQSQGSDNRRRRDKNRATERRLKLEAQVSDVDIGHIADEKSSLIFPEAASDRGTLIFPSAPSAGNRTDSNRSSNDTSRSGSSGPVAVSAILNSEINKSSSLIFPIGVSSVANHEGNQEVWKSIQQRVNMCEKRKFRKKELLLDDLDLTANDIPLQLLNETTLGNTLQKLTLRGNRLKAIPGKLVQCLPSLRELDLQQCDLKTLPNVLWKLPKLVSLDLSNNFLTFFPEEKVLRGVPELRTLNLFNNKISEITLPNETSLLSKLETLDVGANDLERIPDELDQLQSLRFLKLMNNRIRVISRRICEMPSLREIDGLVSNDMVVPPKLECEKGLCMMRRYYHQIFTEEENKKKVKENLRQSQKPKKGYRFLTKMTSSGLKTGGRTSSGSSNERQTPTTPYSLPSPSESGASPSSSAHKTSEVELHALPTKSTTERDVAQPVISQGEERGVTVNDTLKVIFVGMEMVGKTSMIRKLIEGKSGEVPTSQERTIGVRIYDWDPQKVRHFEHVRPQLDLQDHELSKECGDIGVKFSVWDFAGQQVYHATHELFFSRQSLFIIVWDMGRNNANTFVKPRRPSTMSETGAFQLYDSSDDESETREGSDQDGDRLADRALELDIDNKVQFWIDCIQSTCPGSVILPVASHADEFSENESIRRCQIMKRRILQHEERRLVGIKERLSLFTNQKRANDAEALRLQTLLCPLMRPTVLFDEDNPSPIIQTSSPQYTGFADLTESLLDIATGRKKYNGRSLFDGHIGARIPKIRLQVRDTVRSMRSKYKVVEWGFFVSDLQRQGITNVEDISDALHFLTNTGELSYFGKILPTTPSRKSLGSREDEIDNNFTSRHDSDAELDDSRKGVVDDTTATTRLTSDGSLSTIDESPPTLSQYVFLNPLWLVAAVACILRHDLDREIKEARRLLAQGQTRELPRTASFHHAQLNCPIITGEDANLLWQGMPITRKYAERAQEHSVNLSMTPFEFLKILLTEFGVFVPIDLNIDRALFGGMNYQQLLAERETRNNRFDAIPPVQVPIEEVASDAGQYFFLPSLLGSTEHGDPWTFKTNEAWKTTLSHSILFPDGVPSGLMERFTASVLNVLHVVTNPKSSTARFDRQVNRSAAVEGRLVVKEVLCWRKTFLLKLGLQQSQPGGEIKESIMDIFAHLASQCSHLCVGSDYMTPGMHRLIVSGRGPSGDGGRRIWKGGYLLVLRCLQRVMGEYEGVEYEENCICPCCLANLHLRKACSWDMSILRSAAEHYEEGIHCANGHFVESRLVCGPTFPARENTEKFINPDGIKPVEDLFEAVVIVGLWDGNRREIVRAGSGFIVDKKRGLIVTAAHTLMEIWNERDYPFGEDCYGLERGRVVIGLIPRGQSSSGEAVFRYFAQIIVKDPNLQQNTCKVDACVLRIVSRLEQDVGGNGEECGAQAEIFLLNNSRLTKSEQLSSLRLTTDWEREESVRVLGYNQGGEGLRMPGATLNRSIDFARGYIVRLFKNTVENAAVNSSDRNFEPNEELVVNCLTISGHSGGPCVNLQGKVVGILSRADPTENQRCYLVPSSELEVMVREAKNLH